MRIGVNLHPLRPAKVGGHEFYVRNLLDALPGQNSGHEYFLFTTPWNDSTLNFTARNVRKILVASKKATARRISSTTPAGEMYLWAEKLHLDLWFCPMVNLEPRELSIPTVITMPDLQHEFYPQFFSPAELSSRALMYKPSCEQATAVIAISNFTRRCIRERYGIAPEKLFTVHHAAGSAYQGQVALPPPEAMRTKFKLPPLYALFPANTWPHKNHSMLILALHRFRQQCDLPLHLVFTGAEEHGHPFLREIIQHFSLQDSVHHLGYVGDLELACLYQGAAFLVFPSLFEGFGIPLLEAMHMGCPVLANRETSLAEVGGEAILAMDARQPDSIAAAMMRILQDSSLRRELVEKGFARARQFSWEQAARETLAVCEWAYRQPRRSSPREPVLLLDGVFGDGWTSERIRFDIAQPFLVSELVVQGEAPRENCPFEIQVTADCKPVTQLRVAAPGAFRITQPVQIDAQDGRRVRVELLSSRSFTPSEFGGNEDSRSLCYQLERMRVATSDGRQFDVFDRNGN